MLLNLFNSVNFCITSVADRTELGRSANAGHFVLTSELFRQLTQAKDLIKQERYSSAIDLLQPSVSVNPGFSDGLYLIGVSLYHIARKQIRENVDKQTIQHTLDRSRQIQKRVLELEPKSPGAWNVLGVIHGVLWQLTKDNVHLREEEKCLNEALRLDRNFGVAYFNLSHVKFITGNYQESENLFLRSLEHKETIPDPEAGLAIGSYYQGVGMYRQNNFAKALSYFNVSLQNNINVQGRKIDYYLASANYLQGRQDCFQGRFAAAIVNFEKALARKQELTGGDQRGLNMLLGYSYLFKDQAHNSDSLEKARTFLTAALSLGMTYDLVYFWRGIANAKLNRNNEAISDFNRYNRNTFDRNFWLGYAYHGNRDYLKAINYYSQAIRSNPRYKESFFNRGVSYMMLGRLAEAKQDIAVVLQKDRNDVLAAGVMRQIEFINSSRSADLEQSDQDLRAMPLIQGH